jgi:hypothetical protein
MNPITITTDRFEADVLGQAGLVRAFGLDELRRAKAA